MMKSGCKKGCKRGLRSIIRLTSLNFPPFQTPSNVPANVKGGRGCLGCFCTDGHGNLPTLGEQSCGVNYDEINGDYKGGGI